MIRLLPMLALPALAACAPVADAPQTPGAAPAAYMALGTEPGWTLEITPERLNYVGDYGESRIAVPNPGGEVLPHGSRYVTDRLVVDIGRSECSDGMSDRRYANTVKVTADGKALSGCGGAVLPPYALAGSNWTFVSIGDVAVAGDRPTELHFDGTRLSGSAGCNRFSGSYTQHGRKLTAGPLAATKMACPGAGMAQEDAFFKLMSGPVQISFPADGTMILTGAGRQSVVLERVI